MNNSIDDDASPEKSHATFCINSNINIPSETINFNLHSDDQNNFDNTFHIVHNLNKSALSEYTFSSIDSVLNALAEPFYPKSPLILLTVRV